MITFKKEDTKNIKERDLAYFSVNRKHGVIRFNKQVIGFYDLYWSEKDSVELREIDILPSKRYKGYGRSFIAALFNKHSNLKKITGLSMEESIEFYANIGAYFVDSCSSCLNDLCSRHPDSLKEDVYEDDICGDYSDNYFVIERDNFFKTTTKKNIAI